MNNKNLIVNQRKGREQGGRSLNWPTNHATVRADGPRDAGGDGVQGQAQTARSWHLLPSGLTNVSGPPQVPQPGTPGPSSSDHTGIRDSDTPSLPWKEVSVSQEGWETQPPLPQLPSI